MRRTNAARRGAAISDGSRPRPNRGRIRRSRGESTHSSLGLRDSSGSGRSTPRSGRALASARPCCRAAASTPQSSPSSAGGATSAKRSRSRARWAAARGCRSRSCSELRLILRLMRFKRMDAEFMPLSPRCAANPARADNAAFNVIVILRRPRNGARSGGRCKLRAGLKDANSNARPPFSYASLAPQ